MTPADKAEFRRLVEAWEADAIDIGINGPLAAFLIAHASELLALVEADGWRPIDQHTPKDVWLECRRPSLTHPSGNWIAMLIYRDGHWLDAAGRAFEPTHWRPLPKEPQ